MLGEKLHRFDLELTRHVLDNVASHLNESAFASYVGEWVEPAVLAYLQSLDGDAEPPPRLLSEGELTDLVSVFDDEQFQFDRDWIAHESLYRRSIDCVAEIRDGLAKQHADEWASLSAQFAERLEARCVWLHHGIEIVREWVGELRRLLRAMGATNFLPAPEGTFPTPTCSALPAPPTGAVAEPTAQRDDDPLVAAIGKTQALQEEIRDILLSQRRVQDFYSPAEAAAFLGKAEFTVREWCRLGRVNAQKRRSGRGRSLEWAIAHAELLRIQKEGLLPAATTSTRLT
jgi:hypothetical protein